jgi:three-Cys-motif partner protein
MSKVEFFEEFTDSTLTKLDIFSLYAREWLPVFLSEPVPRWSTLHIFDYFAGPGSDEAGTEGSPLRILRELEKTMRLPGWRSATVRLHLFDKSSTNIDKLKKAVAGSGVQHGRLSVEAKRLEFEAAFSQSKTALEDRNAAKLVLLDQWGVDAVSPDVFGQLIRYPQCDFLFFISSSTLNRFRDHPAIKQKITRPEDPFHVHRAVLEYYKELIPVGYRYYLAPFSLKRQSNIYGLIFGSAHPKGMDKFLRVAWSKDTLTGEADFDIDRDNLRGPNLPLPGLVVPRKVSMFEAELERRLRAGELKDESGVLTMCFDFGMRGGHAEPVLKRLKLEKVIQCDFRVPQVDRLGAPRRIHLLDRA